MRFSFHSTCPVKSGLCNTLRRYALSIIVDALAHGFTLTKYVVIVYCYGRHMPVETKATPTNSCNQPEYLRFKFLTGLHYAMLHPLQHRLLRLLGFLPIRNMPQIPMIPLPHSLQGDNQRFGELFRVSKYPCSNHPAEFTLADRTQFQPARVWIRDTSRS